jgi:hypothetical protein
MSGLLDQTQRDEIRQARIRSKKVQPNKIRQLDER